MRKDNAYSDLDATIHSQYGIVLNESNLRSQRHLSRDLHIYFFLSNFTISLRFNPIIVLEILHGKICRDFLA